MDSDYLVGIDSGTQSVRVIIFDAYGNVISQGSANHEPPFSRQPGWAEQQPDDYWEKLCHACQEALQKLHVPATRLAAVGLAAQKAVLISVDEQGNPIRPAFSWMDQRAVSQAVPTPGIPLIHEASWRASKANWMRVHEPLEYEKTFKYLTASAWLIHRLTGEWIDSSGMQVNESPFDVKKMNWHSDAMNYQVYGMQPEKLVDLVPPGALLGCITQQAADETGLPAGLPVVAAASDKVCEVLGSGAVHPGQVSVSYGTLACATVVTSNYKKSKHGHYWTNPGAIPGTWNLEYDIPNGYWLVRWFCEQFGEGIQREAVASGYSLEELFSLQAADIPAGSEGLVLAPYWAAPTLAPLGSGLILGLQAHHGRAHVFKAILEGIIYGLREGLELLTDETGVPAAEIIAGGGGAQNDLTMQATADIFGLPAKRAQTVQMGALGAAIDAAVGAGIYPGFESAAASMTRCKDFFEPIPANQRRYESIYQEIYKPLYPALKDVFRRLEQINQT